MKEKYLKQFDYQPRPGGFYTLVKRLYYSFRNRYIADPTIFLNRNPAYNSWSIGDYTYGSSNGSPHVIHYGEPATLTIGKFCSIADKVDIFLGGNHRTDWVTTYPFNVLFEEATHINGHPQSAGDIHIGHDVWIGQGASILSGVTIGNGAVIATQSLVTKDVPSYTIVGGNPAKILRQRFDDTTIEKLEAIAWWNWSIEKILSNIEILLQGNVTAFVEKHYQTN